MDRELSRKEKTRMRRGRLLRILIPLAVLVVGIILVIVLAQPAIDRDKLVIGTVDRGMIETSVDASGKVVPAYEEIIVSPISARIMGVYSHPGDHVEAGAVLLQLDLSDAEDEANRMRDSRQKQVLAIKQQQLNTETQLTRLQMEIRVKEMNVSRLEAEVQSERRLDSIGTGTGDRVRQAELDYNTARIELEQLRKQLANEKRALAATEGSLQLDLSISTKNLEQQLRTLDDARLRAPRTGTLTFINQAIGQQVQQGEKIAAIADLSSFKIDAEMMESNGRYLSVGGKAFVKISSKTYPATIINVSPLSNQGAVNFSVRLDTIAAIQLRPGLNAQVGVVREVKEDVLRLPVNKFYNAGAGTYDLFVLTADGVIEKRKVELGDANYDYVEVLSGLQAGDRVVLSDMGAYKGTKYKLK